MSGEIRVRWVASDRRWRASMPTEVRCAAVVEGAQLADVLHLACIVGAALGLKVALDEDAPTVRVDAATADRSIRREALTPYSYLHACLDSGAEPVFDDEWLTREVAVQDLRRLRDMEVDFAEQCAGLRASSGDPFWVGQEQQHRTRAGKAEALLAALTGDANVGRQT